MNSEVISRSLSDATYIRSFTKKVTNTDARNPKNGTDRKEITHNITPLFQALAEYPAEVGLGNTLDDVVRAFPQDAKENVAVLRHIWGELGRNCQRIKVGYHGSGWLIFFAFFDSGDGEIDEYRYRIVEKGNADAVFNLSRNDRVALTCKADGSHSASDNLRSLHDDLHQPIHQWIDLMRTLGHQYLLAGVVSLGQAAQRVPWNDQIFLRLRGLLWALADTGREVKDDIFARWDGYSGERNTKDARFGLFLLLGGTLGFDVRLTSIMFAGGVTLALLRQWIKIARENGGGFRPQNSKDGLILTLIHDKRIPYGEFVLDLRRARENVNLRFTELKIDGED